VDRFCLVDILGIRTDTIRATKFPNESEGITLCLCERDLCAEQLPAITLIRFPSSVLIVSSEDLTVYIISSILVRANYILFTPPFTSPHSQIPDTLIYIDLCSR
jgi:hypothetical protein